MSETMSDQPPQAFTFLLIDSRNDRILADGVHVFGKFILSWRGQPADYQLWDSIQQGVEEFGMDWELMEVRWT